MARSALRRVASANSTSSLGQGTLDRRQCASALPRRSCRGAAACRRRDGCIDAGCSADEPVELTPVDGCRRSRQATRAGRPALAERRPSAALRTRRRLRRCRWRERRAEVCGESRSGREGARAECAAASRAGKPAEPAVPVSRLFAAFMEENNIRWGELVGGLLIVGCSIALVISLWSQIAGQPLLQFVLFNGVTAALFGVGVYTDRRWKIHTTSHGLLVIATLLVPLNFLGAGRVHAGVAADRFIADRRRSCVASWCSRCSCIWRVEFWCRVMPRCWPSA